MRVKAYHQSQRALGSMCDITLVADEATDTELLFAGLWLAILTFEKRFSRFLESSELSFINRRAGLDTGISPEMYEILSVTKKMAALTNGRFNPFILPALQRAGYVHSRFPGDEQQAPDYRSRRVVAHDQLVLSPSSVKIPVHSALDLGGIGKGYLGEQLRSHPTLQRVKGYWISLGGDVVGAGTDENGKPWTIAVSDGQTTYTTLSMSVTPFAVATSGVTIHRGSDWHHLIDAAREQPISSPRFTATVVHDSPVVADILATLAVDPTTNITELTERFDARKILVTSQVGVRPTRVKHYEGGAL